MAALTETILAVRLEDSTDGDALIEALVQDCSVLGGMTRLELPGCQVSDETVLHLGKIKNLQQFWFKDTVATSSPKHNIMDRFLTSKSGSSSVSSGSAVQPARTVSAPASSDSAHQGSGSAEQPAAKLECLEDVRRWLAT